MTAYYNEIDPYAAQWLRNLIAAGHIAPGDVDERSIADVCPDDLRGYTQFHTFAGIGVWSYALRMAGWPDDRPVWTGSCPCQPFSSAGKGAGFADERHLWPFWHHLIRVCRPPVVFGEQVASKDGLGWLDLVSPDMEGEGYAFGAQDRCSAGVGAPHIRQRLYFVGTRGLADAEGGSEWARLRSSRAAEFGWNITGHSSSPYMEPRQAGPTNGPWENADWLCCRDGKWRPVEPGTRPLAYGAPSRVGRLRAYGNAIDAENARDFIATFLEAEAAGFTPIGDRGLTDVDLIG